MKVNRELINETIGHPYTGILYPKTMNRENFGAKFVAALLGKWQNMVTSNDFIAIATQFTAQSIAANVRPFIDPKLDFNIGGGGSYNAT